MELQHTDFDATDREHLVANSPTTDGALTELIRQSNTLIKHQKASLKQQDEKGQPYENMASSSLDPTKHHHPWWDRLEQRDFRRANR